MDPDHQEGETSAERPPDFPPRQPTLTGHDVASLNLTMASDSYSLGNLNSSRIISDSSSSLASLSSPAYNFYSSALVINPEQAFDLSNTSPLAKDISGKDFSPSAPQPPSVAIAQSLFSPSQLNVFQGTKSLGQEASIEAQILQDIKLTQDYEMAGDSVVTQNENLRSIAAIEVDMTPNKMPKIGLQMAPSVTIENSLKMAVDMAPALQTTSNVEEMKPVHMTAKSCDVNINKMTEADVKLENKPEIKSEIKPEIKPESNPENADVNSNSPAVEAKKEENTRNTLNLIQERENNVCLGRLYLRSIIEKLEKNAEKFPVLERWIEDFSKITLPKPPSNVNMIATERIDSHTTKPQVMVGLYGATGVGKSSVLNALLERNFLHCNPMRAGTSVATLVSYNFDNDKNHRYRAEIQTVTEREWESELDILFADIRGLSTGEISNASFRSDVGTAIAKIRAVHPSVKIEDLHDFSPAKLIAMLGAENILGRKHTFEASSAEKLKRTINKFINSRVIDDETEDRKPAYWPLVRESHLFVKVEWLRPGIVLVDLPGVADSNAARCVVAENYIKNLNAIWVVAPINRGTDDKTASELLDVSFKRQAKMDGRLNQQHVSFILTRTDDVNVREVEDELGLEQTSWWKSQDSELKTLNAEKSKKITERNKMDKARSHKLSERGRLMKQIKENNVLPSELEHTNEYSKRQSSGFETTGGFTAKRRKLGGQSSETADKQRFDKSQDLTTISKQLAKEIRLLDSQKSKLNDEIEQLHREVQRNLAQTRQFCIQRRNEWSCKEMRSKFIDEIRQFEADLAEEQVEQNLDPPKEEKSKYGSHCEDGDKFDVFTASENNATKGRNKKEDQIKGFFGLDDTGIPQLREHCVQASVQARGNAASNFLDEIQLVNESLGKWIADTSPEIFLSTAQKESLQQVFKTCKEKFNQLTSESHQNTTDPIRKQTTVETPLLLNKAASKAKEFNKSIVEGWFQKGPSQIHWHSLKALCVRDGGPHTNDKGITYNLNKLTLDGFFRVLINPWDELFNKNIPQCMDPLVEALSEAIDELVSNILQGVKEIHPELIKNLEVKMSNAPHLQHIAKTDVVEAFRTFHSNTQDVNRIPQRCIQISLTPLYRACADDSGRGIAARNKGRILETMEEMRDKMFAIAANKMARYLKVYTSNFDRALRKVFQKVSSKVEKEWNIILDAANVAKNMDGPCPDKIAVQNVFKKYISDWHIALTGERKNVLVFATADQIIELDPGQELSLNEVDNGSESSNEEDSDKIDGSDESDCNGQMDESGDGIENGSQDSDKPDAFDHPDYDGKMDYV